MKIANAVLAFAAFAGLFHLSEANLVRKNGFYSALDTSVNICSIYHTRVVLFLGMLCITRWLVQCMLYVICHTA